MPAMQSSPLNTLCYAMLCDAKDECNADNATLPTTASHALKYFIQAHQPRPSLTARTATAPPPTDQKMP